MTNPVTVHVSEDKSHVLIQSPNGRNVKLTPKEARFYATRLQMAANLVEETSKLVSSVGLVKPVNPDVEALILWRKLGRENFGEELALIILNELEKGRVVPPAEYEEGLRQFLFLSPDERYRIVKKVICEF